MAYGTAVGFCVSDSVRPTLYFRFSIMLGAGPDAIVGALEWQSVGMTEKRNDRVSEWQNKTMSLQWQLQYAMQ